MITVWESDLFPVELDEQLGALERKELLFDVAREWEFRDGHIVTVTYNLHIKYPFVPVFMSLNLIKS